MAASYRDLVAWQKSVAFVTDIYRVTSNFPRHELFGLTAQLRRASVSVPSNIAEGQARFSKPEFRHFLRNAKGSLAEVETQLVISKNLGHLNEDESSKLLSKVDELGRILSGLIGSLEKNARH
jgi:four helix bundle protein